MTSRRNLGRQSLSLLVGTWGSAGLNLLLGVLIARRLGPDAVGALGFSVGLSGLVLAALVPGFAQAHMKRVAEGWDVGRCIATMAAIKLALYGAIALVLAAAGPWRDALFETRSLETVFVFLLCGTLAQNFAEVFTTALVARELAFERTVAGLAARSTRFVATVAILALVPDIRWVAAAYTLEGLVELAASIALARWRLGVRAAMPDRETFAGYWRYARPLLVSTPISLVQDSIDRVLVKHWAGLTAAGYYHVARAVWEVLGSLLAAPTSLILARLSSLFARRTDEGVREARAFFASAVDKLLFVTVPAALAVWVFAMPALVLVFGPRFADAEVAVRILVVAALAQVVVNPYTHVVYALDAHERFVPAAVVRFTLYLALLGVLIPAGPGALGLPGLGLGENGAALGRVFAVAFPCWLYVRWSDELAGIGFYRPTATYLGAFVVGAAVFQVIALAPLPSAITLWVAATAAFAAYASVTALHTGARASLSSCLDVLALRSLSIGHRGELGSKVR